MFNRKNRYIELCFWILALALVPFCLFSEPLMLDLSLLSNETVLLENYQGKNVHVRGFWYPLEKIKGGILTPALHLKSCCIGSPLTVQQQIYVSSLALPEITSGQAVDLEGVFRIYPIYDAKGILLEYYHLENAQVILRDYFSKKLVFALIALCSLVCILFYFSQVNLFDIVKWVTK